MKYLLIAVFIFIVGCSNLSEERIWEKDSSILKMKLIEDSVHYKFKTKVNNCDPEKYIDII